MEEKNVKETCFERTHRVGSITTGITLVVCGVFFLLSSVFNLMGYDLVFKFWPIILIGLGAELLWSNVNYKKIVYDKGALALMFMMLIFSVGMAIMNLIISSGVKCISF